jgi:hypothetical protein
MQALPLGELSTTPWSFSPLWFAAMAALVPALVWLASAWRRALLECPNRVRRAGVKEMRRLLKNLRRSDGAVTPAHLHAWLRISARVWDVRTQAPCVSEVSLAARSICGDEVVVTRWHELWLATEQGLYAPNAQPADDWLGQAATAAATVDIPKRERLFPNRLRDWLPNRAPSRSGIIRTSFVTAVMATRRRLVAVRLSRAVSALALAALVIAVAQPPIADADVPWSAPTTSESEVPASSSAESADPTSTQSEQSAEDESPQAEAIEQAPAEPLSPEVQQAAQAALESNWNDWAAHHNLAAYETQQGELNRAIAHAAAAFAQHPDSATTGRTLLAALGDTQTVDPTLRRLVFGAWYERIPTLLSAASWQRVALISALLAAAGLSVMVFAMYAPRPSLPWLGRGAFAIGAVVLTLSISSWSAYGALNQPSAAILLQSANMSPVPTDLVPAEETAPVAAGSLVITGRTFLGWQQVNKGPEASGWIRSNAVMPVYASH